MALTKTDLDSLVALGLLTFIENLRPTPCHFLKRNLREIGTAAMQVSICWLSSVGYHPN